MRFKTETYENLIGLVREEPALYDASLSGYKDHTQQKHIWKKWLVSTPFENLCLVALKIPISDHGIAGSNPAGGKNLPEPKRCIEPFMSTLQSVRYD